MGKYDDRPYAVGKGKPPAHGQIQPGERRNPAGRPKGSQNLAMLLRKVAKERVPYSEGRRQGTISKAEAAIKRLFVRALTDDDPRALALLLDYLHRYERLEQATEGASTAERGHTDIEILKALRIRLTGGEDDRDK